MPKLEETVSQPSVRGKPIAIAQQVAHNKRDFSFYLKKWFPVYLMMLPGLAYLFINNYIPMTGIIVAFKQYNAGLGIYRSPWVGLKNFEFLFKTSDAFLITRNTILYNIAFIIINTVLGIAIAIFISEVYNKTFKKLYQSAILLPFLLSTVILSYIVFSFLSSDNGFINKSILPLFGQKAISWYTSPQYWPYIIIIVNTWKGVGFGCLIYIAGIAGIDKELYEAAEIDGARKMRQIWSITLPSLVPSIIMLTLLSIGKIFYSDFGLFYQVTMDSGSLYNTTNVIDTYVYRALLEIGSVGMSSAAGVYQSVVGFMLVLISNGCVRKLNKDSALF